MLVQVNPRLHVAYRTLDLLDRWSVPQHFLYSPDPHGLPYLLSLEKTLKNQRLFCTATRKCRTPGSIRSTRHAGISTIEAIHSVPMYWDQSRCSKCQFCRFRFTLFILIGERTVAEI